MEMFYLLIMEVGQLFILFDMSLSHRTISVDLDKLNNAVLLNVLNNSF